MNALLVPYLLSAVRMVESGFASPADIDAGMVSGCAHPMGPLRLTDLIGVDRVAAIASSMHSEFKEPLYPAATDAAADSRYRAVRTQERARLLRVRLSVRYPGSLAAPQPGQRTARRGRLCRLRPAPGEPRGSAPVSGSA